MIRMFNLAILLKAFLIVLKSPITKFTVYASDYKTNNY